MKKNYLTSTILILFYILTLKAQTSDELWTPTTELNKKESNKIKNVSEPSEYKLFNLNFELLKSKLNTSPKRSVKSKKAGTIITFPNELGELHKYEVFEASVMSDGLQKKFPNLKSYIGKGLDDPSLLIRLSLTTQGLNVVILNSPRGTIYINTYTNDIKSYKIYSTKSLPKTEPFECEVVNAKENEQRKSNGNSKISNSNNGYFRTIRLAVIATAEYSNWHLQYQGIDNNKTEIEKKEVVLSAIVASMTKVNAVFERDISLSMVLVEDSEKIIFLNSLTDELTGDDKYKLLNEGNTIVKDIIGFENYDISHVYSAFDLGGVAMQTSICNINKPNGVSSSSSPIGNYFENVIMHEIGHQFGASHTYNKCSKGFTDYSISNLTSVEPGSGSTIMSYGGVCWGDDNVVKDRDIYFHGISIQQMIAKLNSDNSICMESSLIENSPPVIIDIADYTVPISSPIKLVGDVSNANSDSYTYTWEQFDAEIGISPPESTQIEGPIFRSYPPTNSGKRSLPNKLSSAIGQRSNKWEVLPSVSRTVNFGLTVRNNNLNFPQTAFMQTKIIFDENSGPFEVTSQNNSEKWNIGETKTITWNVANTDKSPILCSKVNILFSPNTGSTYTIALASNIENNGSFDIIVPNLSTSGGKIKVESVGNIFYSVNKGYISINPPVGKIFVPDDIFEQYLIENDYDTSFDNYIYKNKAKSINYLLLNELDIYDLTGIEEFDNLIELVCFSTQITSLDLSNKSRLESIYLINNNINYLNLSNCTNLNKINVEANNLSEINVSNFELLEDLDIGGNNINTINVSKNLNLKILSAKSTSIENIDVLNNKLLTHLSVGGSFKNINGISKISEIDVRNNSLLNDLSVSHTNITSLDITNNKLLENLSLANTNITSLDISNNPLLTHLDATNSDISILDISSNTKMKSLHLSHTKINEIDVSENLLLENFNAIQNPNLKCIKVNQNQLNNIPIGWNVDNNVSYSLNCSDNDNDGIIDDKDQCLETPTGETVNENGCSQSQIDDDNDGIMNDEDVCSDTPEGETVNENGCSQSQLDDDNDGVMNDKDLCPVTPTGETVNENGCSQSQIDDDKDGVMNDKDLCPETPEGETVNENGCSQSQLDDDNDSIMNDKDLCPETPEDEIVNTNGCSQSQLDDDNDSIMNDKDLCPETPEDEIVNTNGCSQSQLDDDNDGVMNDKDLCSETPEGETVNENGCSQSQLDDDNDGVMNDKDLCPDTPEGEIVNFNGCIVLPSNNFKIETINETCPNKNNGQIKVSATATYDYLVTINGNEYNLSNDLTIENLEPGTYDICIIVPNITSKQCYSVEIEEGTEISGKTTSISSNKVSIDIEQGTAPFNVLVNGNVILKTMSSSFDLNIKHGDLVEIQTDKNCEGTFSKTIDLFEEVTAYPNPTSGIFEIALPVSLKEIKIDLFTLSSQLISSEVYQVINGKVQLDIQNKPNAVYLIKVHLESPVSVKIIKE
ncbi:reprolysin-like metallopeptidase [Lutibacter oceani]|nr:zinc-dependent metalloprotease family protein [Lutibacter oceani]